RLARVVGRAGAAVFAWAVVRPVPFVFAGVVEAVLRDAGGCSADGVADRQRNGFACAGLEVAVKVARARKLAALRRRQAEREPAYGGAGADEARSEKVAPAWEAVGDPVGYALAVRT